MDALYVITYSAGIAPYQGHENTRKPPPIIDKLLLNIKQIFLGFGIYSPKSGFKSMGTVPIRKLGKRDNCKQLIVLKSQIRSSQTYIISSSSLIFN